jgi:Tol biopolymer transport system component
VLGPPPNTVFTPVGLVPAAVTVSVSPDGRQLLYRANRPGDRGRLWLRSLDSVEAIPIDDTEGGIFPFWSPGGRSIAFATGGALKRKDLAGGPSRTLVENVVVRGGTWNRDGVILYAAAAQGIFRVSADGGAPAAMTNPDVGHGESHTFPQFLPDGEHFLYLARAAVIRLDPSVNTPDLWLIDVDRGAESRFTFRPQIDLSPVFSPGGARVAFSSKSDMNRLEFQVFERATAGGAEERPLFVSDDSTHGARMADSSCTRPIRRPTTTISNCCVSATAAQRRSSRRASASTRAACPPTAGGWRTRQRRPARGVRSSLS